MIKISLIANLSYNTAKINTIKEFDEFLAKNNNAKNWTEKQQVSIIVNNNFQKNGLSVPKNVERNDINKLLLNNNMRNNDGHLHSINITIYAKDINSINCSDHESIYNTYLVNNAFSQYMFQKVKLEKASVNVKRITKIECLSELCHYSSVDTISVLTLVDFENLNANMSCIDKIAQYKADDDCVSENDYLEKHKNLLEENTELKNEVERIFKTKSDCCINYASYYFNNRAIFDKYKKVLVEALFIAGRIKSREYYEIDTNLYIFNRKSNWLFFKELLNTANGLFIHFNISYYQDFNQKYLDNGFDQQMSEDAFNNVISVIQKIQYSTVCSFSVNINDFETSYNIKSNISKLFRIVPFNNELSLQGAIEYATKQLQAKDLILLESTVKRLVRARCDENDNGLSKGDVEKIICDVQKKYASDLCGKEYSFEYVDLNNVIGLDDFKHEMARINNLIDLPYKNNKLSISQTNEAILNMCYRFEGETGVGKSFAASILARNLYSLGVLSTDTIMRAYSIKDVIENYEAIVQKKGIRDKNTICDDTYDVLLIETIKDATALELNNFLSKFSELNKQYLVILCGSKKDFEKMDDSVPGFKSKFPRTIKFSEYSTDELMNILNQTLKERKYSISESAIQLAHKQFEKARLVTGFSNVIFVLNYVESLIRNSLNRVFNGNIESDSESNVYTIVDEDINNVDMVDLLGNEYKKIVTYENAMNELDALIGLTTVKSYIKSYIAKSKIDKLKMDLGYGIGEGLNMHLCFTGNPGTAKTTVARCFAKILYNNGIITKPDIVECGLSDLQAEYLGQTSPKVISKFEEARGGVLFIDEAYSLNNDDVYSKQTIDTIVAQLENNREEVIVIFAGYREPMEEFVKANQGIKGRVSRFIDFPNYNIDELMNIFDKMIADKKYVLEDEINIKSYVKNFLAEKMTKEDFANGREVRLLIENAILNQSMRLFKESNLDVKNKDVLMTLKFDDFIDEGEDFYKEKNKIGFIA